METKTSSSNFKNAKLYSCENTGPAEFRRAAGENLPTVELCEPHALASGASRIDVSSNGPDASAYGSGKFSIAVRLTPHQLWNPSLLTVGRQGSDLVFDLFDMNGDGLEDVVVYGKKTTLYLSEPNKGPPLVGNELGFQAVCHQVAALF